VVYRRVGERDGLRGGGGITRTKLPEAKIWEGPASRQERVKSFEEAAVKKGGEREEKIKKSSQQRNRWKGPLAKTGLGGGEISLPGEGLSFPHFKNSRHIWDDKTGKKKGKRSREQSHLESCRGELDG